MNRFKIVCIAALALAAVSSVRAEEDVEKIIAATPPGSAAKLPAGTFHVKTLKLPPGVGLVGAGYQKTVLEVSGAGIVLDAGGKVTVSDLTISSATDAALEIDNAADVTVSRVRLSKSLVGLRARNSTNVRIENAVVAGNRTGIALTRCTAPVVVNCSIVDSEAEALFLVEDKGAAIFNNLFAVSPLAEVITGGENLAIDHNLFSRCAFVGKGADIHIPTVYTWRSTTGYDRHSVILVAQFKDAAAYDYHVTNSFAWGHDRAISSGWGATALGSITAPTADIDGHAYAFGPCAGAYESPLTPDRPADGQFTVEDGDGDTSAGVFAKDGNNLAYLFDLLPLKKGTYNFWLPSRDWKSEPIAAGDYDVRVVESKLALKYVNSIGNTGIRPEHGCYANDHSMQVVFDAKDRPVIGIPWSEAYQNFRGMDAKLEEQRWGVPGCKRLHGMASDGNGSIYGLNEADAKSLLLRKINAETGAIEEIRKGEICTYLPKETFKTLSSAEPKDILGMAELKGTLYIADSDGNKLWTAPVADPDFKTGIEIAAPSKPAADRVHNLVWVISKHSEIIGCDTNGAIAQKFDPGIPGIFDLAINGNRMALLSSATGKIYVYDCSDVKAIKPLLTIGTGDGPYGPLQPDRFLFQQTKADQVPHTAAVALDSTGKIAVCDRLGVKLFAADGKIIREFTGVWAQESERGPVLPDGTQVLIEKTYPLTLLLDPKTNTWKQGEFLSIPEVITDGKHRGQLETLFNCEGKLFGVVRAGPFHVYILRFDKGIGAIVDVYSARGTSVFRLDGPPTGPLTKDTRNWIPVVDADGKPMTTPFPIDFPARLVPTPDGSLNFSGPLVPLKGLDSRGRPNFDWAAATGPKPWISNAGPKPRMTFISPYDGKTSVNLVTIPTVWGEYFGDGSRVSNIQLNTPELVKAKANPGNASGFANHGGSDLIGAAPDNHIRWFRKMNEATDPEGARVVDDLVYTVSMPAQEFWICDKDGFLVGVCNVPKDLWWAGMWLDNCWQFNAFKGPDGAHNALIGNFNDCVIWWLKVDGATSIKRHSTPLTVNTNKADTLAALPPPALPTKAAGRETTLTIKHLDAPLPIDGTFEKWSKLLPRPQIIITPEASGGFKGAKDCCALVRLAYHDKDLYVQQIRFDDIITTHQLSNAFYMQDCVEMSLNSYRFGVKINASMTHDNPELLFRDGWFLKGFALDQQKAPHKFRLLSAKEVPDRALMESITGEDLSQCQVQVFEYKVTLDAALFEKRAADVIPDPASGKTIRIGISIDDNDIPGVDMQKMLNWPATYGTFNPLESSALATFE